MQLSVAFLEDARSLSHTARRCTQRTHSQRTVSLLNQGQQCPATEQVVHNLDFVDNVLLYKRNHIWGNGSWLRSRLRLLGIFY